MDALSASSPVREVVFMKGAQVGATEAGNNWIGYAIHHSPAGFLVVQPTVELAKRMSKQRIDPMIAECPELASRVADKRARDSANTVLGKDFPGGTLCLTGANSAVGLRSMSAKYLFEDEYDAYPGDVGGEGDPGKIAERATRTYKSTKKTFKVSTPTIEGRSRIEADFEKSDRRFYHVPCPHCGEMQRILWKNIKWEKGQPETAYLACEINGCVIEEHHKTEMLAGGEWIPENPESPVRGYHLSALYSPVGWYSWKEAASDFMEAKDDPEKMRVFVNTVLGETYKERGEAPKWEVLYRRRESYPFGFVPAGGLFLTMGADVQGNYIQGEVVAWGRDKQSWSIDVPIFSGDTSSEEPWDELESYWQSTFEHELGARLPILKLAIDRNWSTQTVDAWVKSQGTNRVIGVRGEEKLRMPIGLPKKSEVKSNGKVLRRGGQYWPVGTSLLKSELYGWLKREEPLNPEEDGYPPGWCHFPQYGEEFFKQLTAEEIRLQVKRGFKHYVWENVRPGNRNEAIDCRVYARAAANLLGIDRASEEDWDEWEAALQAGLANPSEPNKSKEKPRQKRRRRSKDKSRKSW